MEISSFNCFIVVYFSSYWLLSVLMSLIPGSCRISNLFLLLNLFLSGFSSTRFAISIFSFFFLYSFIIFQLLLSSYLLYLLFLDILAYTFDLIFWISPPWLSCLVLRTSYLAPILCYLVENMALPLDLNLFPV